MKRMTTLKIGPVSEGINLPSKIAGAIYAMEQLSINRSFRMRVDAQRRRWNQLVNIDQSVAEDIWLMLEEILEAHLPPYCRLVEVDGVPTVLPDNSLIAEDLHGGDIGSVRTQTARAPAYVLEVNDHGNMTLFCRRASGRGHRWIEVWSVV